MGVEYQRQLPVANQLERRDSHPTMEYLYPIDPGRGRFSDHQKRSWCPADLSSEVGSGPSAYSGMLFGLGNVAHLAAVDVGLGSWDSTSKATGGDERDPIDGCPAAYTGENAAFVGGQHRSQGPENSASSPEAADAKPIQNDSKCSADFCPLRK